MGQYEINLIMSYKFSTVSLFIFTSIIVLTLCIIISLKGEINMKNTIKIATAISAVLVSSTALGVTGMDRLVFSPSFMFEEGNFAELTLAKANPSVSPAFASKANVAKDVNTLRFAYKHQINDRIGLGMMINNQPVGVDVDYKVIGNGTRGSVSAKSYIALGHYKATERVSAYGGVKYQTQEGNADLSVLNPTVPSMIQLVVL